MKNKFILGIIFLIFNHLQAQTDLSAYPWIHPELNGIQYFNKSALEKFHNKLQNPNGKKISVMWLGDSHIQPDIVTEVVRKKFQKEYGDAGRGILFPWSTARTYSSLQYTSTHVGPWSCSRSIEPWPRYELGVQGATCKVKVPNSYFTLTFQVPVPKEYTVLRVYCKKAPNMFDFQIIEGVNRQTIKIMDADPDLPYIEVKIPSVKKSITLKVIKNNALQNDFEFYGMSLETEGTGFIMHTCGIGGAQFSAPLYQKRFMEQLPAFEPDLIILDYGGNDYYYDNTIRPTLEADIVQIIKNIRKVAPNASIIITTTMDLIRRGWSLPAGPKYTELIRKICKENDCGYYDWFYISGGQHAMWKWVKAGIAQPDYIHLTMKGYQLKGDLFYDALQTTFTSLKDGKDSLVYSLEGYKHIVTTPAVTNQNTVQASGKSITHIIKYGETLGHIALKYKTSVSKIMQWNNLKTSRIVAGKRLIIYQ